MKKLIITTYLLVSCILVNFAQFSDNEKDLTLDNEVSEYNYNGTYTSFHQNDQTERIVSINNGVADGITKYFSPEGQLIEERAYADNEKHGKWRVFFEDGSLKSMASYKNDKKDGTWKVWDEAGTLRYVLHYKNGVKVGTWESYDDNGVLYSARSF